MKSRADLCIHATEQSGCLACLLVLFMSLLVKLQRSVEPCHCQIGKGRSTKHLQLKDSKQHATLTAALAQPHTRDVKIFQSDALSVVR